MMVCYLLNSVTTGVFPLTVFESEIVLSLKTDPQDQHLIAGDTFGSISVFDIGHYGTSPLQVAGILPFYLTVHFAPAVAPPPFPPG